MYYASGRWYDNYLGIRCLNRSSQVICRNFKGIAFALRNYNASADLQLLVFYLIHDLGKITAGKFVAFIRGAQRHL